MAETKAKSRFRFPRWANYALPAGALGAGGGLLYMIILFTFGASPKTMAVGYAPTQPVPYSHALHVGKLGLDCRYCHNTVEKTAFAALPATQTCMNCHTNIRPESSILQPVRDSWATGKAVPWVKVHDLPDYVYFNHSAHVSHGVGCVECHGRIDQMEVVHQAKPLSMGWCLDCHRDPAPHLRPKDVPPTDMHYTNVDPVTGADLMTPDQRTKLMQEYKIHDYAYMQSCYTCHR
jgi:menaquinone reductase, multiheme cytochrome c subunit